MKTKFFLFFLFLSPFLFAEDDITELILDDTRDYALEQINAMKENKDDKLKTPIKEKKEIAGDLENGDDLEKNSASKKKYVASAKHSITVSIFYPFFMGSAPTFIYDAVYPSTKPDFQINGGLDFFLKIVLKNYVTVNGGFAWGGSFVYNKKPDGKKESDTLYSMMNFRFGAGGIYPVNSWFSFGGGLNIGYMHIAGDKLLASINDVYKNSVVSMFMIEPYISMDFEIANNFSLSFKFDYIYGVSGKKNRLNTEKNEDAHFPSLYVGLGFLF